MDCNHSSSLPFWPFLDFFLLIQRNEQWPCSRPHQGINFFFLCPTGGQLHCLGPGRLAAPVNPYSWQVHCALMRYLNHNQSFKVNQSRAESATRGDVMRALYFYSMIKRPDQLTFCITHCIIGNFPRFCPIFLGCLASSPSSSVGRALSF